MAKSIVSKYPGKCRLCKREHAAGDRVMWAKGIRGVLCLSCGMSGHEPEQNKVPTRRKSPEAPRKDESERGKVQLPEEKEGGGVVRRWLSWSEYVRDAVAGADRDGRSHDNDRGFFGTDSFEEAVTLANNGWSAIRSDVDALVDKIEKKVAPSLQPAFESYFDVSGGMVDIGRYLDGEPECMVETRLIEIAKPGRVITILVNGCFSAGIPGESVKKRGAAIVGLVDALERLQHSTEIWLEVPFSGGITYVVQLKSAGEALDIDKLMFAIGHESALRRINFGIQEGETSTVHQKCKIGRPYSYGVPGELTQGNALGATVQLEKLGYYNEEAQNPEAWIIEQLSEFGLVREEG